MASVFRVLALENSFIHVAQIHIEEHLTSNTVSDWQWILSELVSVEQEFKEVKRHNYQRWERELNPLELTQGDRLRKGGVYLIAGGMGMIGKEIALHLHALYDAKVILVGRSPLSPEKQVWLQQWQSGRQADLGGQLCYMQADITILADTEQLVENLLHRFGRLDGVIHSAGVLKDALVQNKLLMKPSSSSEWRGSSRDVAILRHFGPLLSRGRHASVPLTAGKIQIRKHILVVSSKIMLILTPVSLRSRRTKPNV